MKFFLRIIFLLFPVAAIAQDSVVTITPSMFDKTIDQFLISKIDGWIFKQGSDTNWAKTDIDITGWKKLKPVELSAKYAHKTGKAECWFRIKIKADSTLDNLPLGIKSGSWGATDVYIDGKLVLSTGNTGSNGKPFKEPEPYGNSSYPANLIPGKSYTLSLHFVDYVSPLPPTHLKSEDIGLSNVIRITGSKYNALLIQNLETVTIYNSIWIVATAVLCLLFWLLYIQNPFEKNLRLIALGSTFFALSMFCNFSAVAHTGMSYNYFELYNLSFGLFSTLSLLIMTLIVVNIFKRRVTAALKVFLVLFFIGVMTSLLFSAPIGPAIGSILVIAIFSVCIYYIISSWKKLKGAQWAIVVGLLLALAWLLLYLLTTYLFGAHILLFQNLSFTGYALSFPLSLLVYVSMRFKEIIKEVRQKAQQVVKLSEEKKEQALNQQKLLQEEVKRQTAEIRTTLDELKSTQSQLIQSEKMASLGELTAGIAHEIQNPLNFVNNFSEVNAELIDEAGQEIEKGNVDEVKIILNDIKDNSEKINRHGKRADAIVKGMLQHSRSSTGVKEPTGINALCDEYLRLSYHGLRAKDKSFNAEMKTNFDETIGKINIIPQDIGRVLLNLYNNAFYAVHQKQKELADLTTFEKLSNLYEPTVFVSTKKSNNHVIVTVSDNGNGIPQNIVDKIFQPFFTTKPTGEGTGLGLSLSYDIIKAHGGEIKVETKEKEGSIFIIQLPNP